MTSSSPTVDQYQCPGCKADMVFAPSHGQLKCLYCGRTELLPQANHQTMQTMLQENDLMAFINTHETRIGKLSTTAQQAQWPGCKAQVTFEPREVAGRCPFCGTSIVTGTLSADPTLAPAGLIPFVVGRQDA